MFKTISQIKKKIIAAAMTAAILVSGNVGTSSVISGNHSIMGTTVTVSAKKVIFLCPECDRQIKDEKKYYEHMASVHNADKCPYCGEFATRNRTALENHKQTCPCRPHIYYVKACPYNYDDHGCTLDSWSSEDAYNKHLDECHYRNHCPLCNEKFIDFGRACDFIYNTPEHVKSHVTYDCLKNDKRCICEKYKQDLKNRGLRLPTWSVKDQLWECPYPDYECYKKFTTESLVKEHIDMHYGYVKKEK